MKNFYRYLVITAMMLVGVAAKAQVTFDVHTQLYSSKAVFEEDGALNAMTGTGVRVVFSVDKKTVSLPDFKIVSGTYSYDRRTNEPLIDLTSDPAGFGDVALQNPAVGESTFTYTINYTYSQTDEEGNKTTLSGVATGSADKKVKIWPAAAATPNADVPTELYSGESASFSVTTAGGYSGAWTMEWPDGKTGSTWTYVAPEVTSAQNAPISVKVKNQAPAASSAWYDETLSWPMVVYPTPNLTLTCPRNEMVSGEKTVITATGSGGKDGAWTYSWTVDGVKQTATTPAFEYTAANNGTSTKIVTVSVTAKNNAGATPYTETKSWLFTVYPPIKVEATTPSVSAYFSDSEVTMTIKAEGGNPNTWSYEWKDDAGNVVGSGTSLTVKVENNGANLKTLVYNVAATNMYDNQVSASHMSFLVDVYPKPTAILSEYPVNVINSHSVPMEVEVNGGDSSAWTYKWSVDGVQSGTARDFTFAPSNTAANGSRTQKVSVTATNTPANIDKPYTSTFEKTYTVWATPKLKSQTGTNQVVFHGTTVNMDIEMQGGVTAGWNYQWSLNGTNVGADSSLSAQMENTSSTSRTDVYKLHVTNECEGEIVFDETYDYSITVWPTPVATLPTDYPVNVINGQQVPMTMEVSGGDLSKWTYAWATDGSHAGTSKDYTYAAVNTNANGSLTQKVTVTATNTPFGIDKTYTTSAEKTYTVWATPKLKSQTGTSQVVFNGTTVNMGIEMQGGVTDSWNYQWSLNGTNVGTSSSLSARMENTSSTSRTDVYKVRVTNECEGKIVFDETYDYSITVWPTPVATLPTDYPVNVINGQQVPMTMEVSGGDPSKWTYTWSAENGQSGSAQSFNYGAVNTNANGSLTQKVTVTATNTPAGIDKPYTISYEKTYTVWATPSVKTQTIDKPVVFNGTTVRMSVVTEGGVTDAWHYQWSLNGEPLGTASNQSAILENIGSTYRTDTYKLRVTNECEGEIVFDQTLDYVVVVWPTPAATLPTDYPVNVINGQQVPMTMEVSGGDPDKWTYAWATDGSHTGTSKDYTYAAVNTGANGSLTQKVTITATNAPTAIDKAYTTSYEKTYTVWATPKLKSQTGTNQAVFNGTTVNMGIEVQGGVAGSWSFRWSLNGTNLGTDPTMSDQMVNTSSAARTDVYKLHVINECEGEIVFDETYDYSITVWPTPVATLPTDYPVNVINGQQVPMTVNVSGGDPNAWTYSWQSESGQTGFAKTFDYSAINADLNGSVTQKVKVTATNTPANIDKAYTISYEKTYTVWATPKLKSLTGMNQVVFNGTTVNMGIEMQGGVTDGWNYQWSLNGTNLGTDPSMSVPMENTSLNARTDIYKLRVTNVCEGNVVFDETYDYCITVWPTPEATLPTYVDNVINGQEVPMTVNVSGGDPNAWTYSWATDGAEPGYDSVYRYTSVNTNADGSLTQKVTVTAINTPGGIDKPYTVSFEKTYTVWATPKVKSITGKNQVVYNGTTVNMGIEMQGGVADGWSYQWSLNGTQLGTEPTMSAEMTNVGMTSRTDTYKLRAVNICEGNVVFDVSFDYSITVWPTPEATLPTYVENVINGQEVPMTVNVSGGNPNAWTYSWATDSKLPGSAKDYTYKAVNAAVDGSVTQKVTVTATNIPEGIDRAYSTSFEKTYTVWATPSVKSITGMNQVVFNGTTVNMGIEMQGGVAGGWSYQWSLNGAQLGNEPTHSSRMLNTGSNSRTDVYKLRVTNECEGVLVFDATYDYNITVWPTPEATLPTYSANVINGQEVPMTVNISGGDILSWTYRWDTDAKLIGSAKNYTYKAVNAAVDGSVTQKVTVTATNAPAGIDKAYSTSFEKTFTVWATPSLKSQTGTKQVVYNGTTVNMGIVMQGGVANGWSYQWSLNGTQLGTEPTRSTKMVNNGNTSRTDVYKLRVTNVCEGEVVFDKTYDYTITVWPTPEATLPTTEYPTDVINGQVVEMGITRSGGDPLAWTYAWSAANGQTGSAQKFNYKAANSAAEGVITQKVSVAVANKPVDIDKPYTNNFEYTYNVWATPTLKSRTPQSIEVCSGQTERIGIEVLGGYTPGWTFKWTLDGKTIGDKPTFDAMTVNPGTSVITKTYTLVATNTLDGEVRFSETYVFNVKIWAPAEAKVTEASYPDNVLSGDKIPMTVTYNGGQPDAWTVSWTVNGAKKSNVDKFEFSGTATGGPEEYKVAVQVDNKPAAAADFAFRYNYSHSFTVWPLPVVTSVSPLNQVSYNGYKKQIGVSVAGGQNGGWLFEWTKNGSAIKETGCEFEVNTINTGTTKITDTYVLKITNSVDGVKRFETSYTFVIDIYPAASAKAQQSEFTLYYGETANMNVVTAGGYPSGWSYEWSKQPAQTGAQWNYTVPTVSEDGKTETFLVKATNRYQSEVWYEEEMTFTLHEWSRGTVTAVPLDSLEYDGRAIMDLKSIVKGGNPDGWTFRWTNNGAAESGETEHDIAVAQYNQGETVDKYTYVLTAINRIGDRKGSETALTYEFNVWPEIYMPSGIVASAYNIREGNTLTLKQTPDDASGGYQYKWNYDWTRNGVTVGQESSLTLPVPAQTASDMGSTTWDFALTLNNPGPYGKNWAGATFKTATVNVYRRPLTPTALEKKGTGVSCTMIAMLSSLTDDQLASLKYIFVYGYTDRNGQDHTAGSTPNRYFRFEKSVYDDTSNRFWVYTEWNYADGSSVTSGKRYLDGSADESFDGSVYTQTGRGDYSDMDELRSQNFIKIYDGYFEASVTSSQQARVNVYTSEGALVRTETYPKATHFLGTFDVETLVPGFYIVEVRVGSLKETKKIVVTD